MNAKTLDNMFSEMDLQSGQIDVSFMPMSGRYGSAVFANKVTKQVYHCKFVAIHSKYRITAVITKGKSWFGSEGHLMAERMLNCPSGDVAILRVITN